LAKKQKQEYLYSFPSFPTYLVPPDYFDDSNFFLFFSFLFFFSFLIFYFTVDDTSNRIEIDLSAALSIHQIENNDFLLE